MSTDRVEKMILLKAPRSRVWKAISNSQEFGAWFGMKLDGPPGGVMLTVTESGFDQLPLDRRATAFAADEECWDVGNQLLELYLARVS